MRLKAGRQRPEAQAIRPLGLMTPEPGPGFPGTQADPQWRCDKPASDEHRRPSPGSERSAGGPSIAPERNRSRRSHGGTTRRCTSTAAGQAEAGLAPEWIGSPDQDRRTIYWRAAGAVTWSGLNRMRGTAGAGELGFSADSLAGAATERFAPCPEHYEPPACRGGLEAGFGYCAQASCQPPACLVIDMGSPCRHHPPIGDIARYPRLRRMPVSSVVLQTSGRASRSGTAISRTLAQVWRLPRTAPRKVGRLRGGTRRTATHRAAALPHTTSWRMALPR